MSHRRKRLRETRLRDFILRPIFDSENNERRPHDLYMVRQKVKCKLLFCHAFLQQDMSDIHHCSRCTILTLTVIAALSSIRTNLSPFTKGCRDRGASMRVLINFLRGYPQRFCSWFALLRRKLGKFFLTSK